MGFPLEILLCGGLNRTDFSSVNGLASGQPLQATLFSEPQAWEGGTHKLPARSSLLVAPRFELFPKALLGDADGWGLIASDSQVDSLSNYLDYS